MTTTLPLSWQPKIKKTKFNFTEANRIVKIKGLCILPLNKKQLVNWTIVCHYTPLPQPMSGY